ncbi:MAG: hypothetical protein ACFFB3_22645 [Candidatus Hodarchaeota archaeon]
MIVHIELMAIIRRPNNLPRVFSWEFTENTQVKTLLEDLGFSSQESRFLQVFVTRGDLDSRAIRAPRNFALQNNDRVFITMPVGGG